MMKKQKIDIVYSGEWYALYLNGKKVIEVPKHDDIKAEDVLKALEIPFETYGVESQSPKEYFADLKL